MKRARFIQKTISEIVPFLRIHNDQSELVKSKNWMYSEWILCVDWLNEESVLRTKLNSKFQTTLMLNNHMIERTLVSTIEQQFLFKIAHSRYS